MKKCISTIGIVVCLLVMENAYTQHFNYQRTLKTSADSAKWYGFAVPDEMYDVIKNDFSDVRIYDLSQSDSIEIPFLVSRILAGEQRNEVASEMINPSKNEKGYYFTFRKINELESIDEIELLFANKNFDWNIRLEGSHDLQQWFTILEDYRILSFENNTLHFRHEKIKFPTSQYSYYRIFIPAKEEPVLKSARLNAVSEKQDINDLKRFTVENLEVSEDRKERKTIVSFAVTHKIPLQAIKLNIDNRWEYQRSIHIEYLIDSTRTEKGWMKHYGNFSSGYVSSTKKNIFEYESSQEVFANEFRITLFNDDNPILKIKTIDLYFYRHQILFGVQNNQELVVLYGNKQAHKPQYDIENFRSQIENSEIVAIDLSEEKINPKAEDIRSESLFEKKGWLWTVMIVLIAILCYFGFRMLRT